MLKNVLKRKRSVVFVWLLSYAIILLVPILFSVFIYTQASRLLENEINQSNNFLLKRVQQYMDSLLVDVESLSHEIMFNSNLQALLQHRGALTDAQQYIVYQTVQNFKLYKISNTSIDRFFVYFKDYDLVISDSTSTDSRTYFESYYAQGRVAYWEWFDFIKQNYSGEYKSQPWFQSNGGYTGGSYTDGNKTGGGNTGGNVIVFSRSIPTISKDAISANMFIPVDESRFLRDAEGIEFTSGGNVFIINGRNEIIASTSPLKDTCIIEYEALQDENGLCYAEFSGERIAVSYIKSTINDWKYVSVIPVGVFLEKLEYIRSLTHYCLLLCMIIAGLISYACIRKNYKPLNDLLGLFKNKNFMFDKWNNEFSLISQAIHKTLDENSRISLRLMEQNKGMKSVFLSRLLKGREGAGANVQEILSGYNIHFDTDYFAVIVFYINNIDEVFSESKELDNVQRVKLMQFVITNVVEELIKRKNTGFMTEVDEMMVCLINLKDPAANDWKTEICDAVSEAQEFIEMNFSIQFIYTISNMHETLLGVPQAYTEALRVMEYRMITGKNEPVFFNNMNVLPKADYYYPLEKEYQLINCIKAGDFNGASILLNEILDTGFEKYTPSVEIARCLMFNMVSTILRTMNDMRDICRNDFLEELKPVEKLMQCSTISQMKPRILEIVDKVCSYLKSYNQSTDYSIRDRVIEFIDKNYDDINLGNSIIADALGLNPDYVSAAFKRQTGEGLLDYINAVRIEKARQVLKEYSCNLDEIAGKVGYTNTRTFTRLFKKYEGITPGKFRELLRQNVNNGLHSG